MDNIKKVVLAYSGGLDTSVIIRWLIDNYNCEVIAFAADLGQNEDLKPLRDKAIKTGASKIYIEDIRDEFANEYIIPSLQANAVYEGKYYLATALGRPLITKKMVEIAEKEKADAIAHGSTGKGNDQVRFDVSAMSLNPDLKIIAPVRNWELKSREEEIEYAEKHNIPVSVTKEKPYSIDRNLWGISIECGVLEDPWHEPPDDIYSLVTNPKDAPDKPTYVEIYFEKGIPKGINGKEYDLVELITKLNEIAGRNGVGLSDMVENRLVGIKSREIYEAPAATVLHMAHKELESLVLDRETCHFKESIAIKYSELIYYGLWFSPLKEALDAFIKNTQKNVTGTIRLKLYKGTCIPVGRKSEYSLYDLSLATYEAGDMFDHKAGEAFCKIWGLPSKIRAMVEKRKKK